MTLALSGISYPCHHLSVCRRSSPANAQEPTEEVYIGYKYKPNPQSCGLLYLWAVSVYQHTSSACLQCADVHMISDSEGEEYEDATEFGVDDSEMFGMSSSSCRKSPMSTYNQFVLKF